MVWICSNNWFIQRVRTELPTVEAYMCCGCSIMYILINDFFSVTEMPIWMWCICWGQSSAEPLKNRTKIRDNSPLTTRDLLVNEICSILLTKNFWSPSLLCIDYGYNQLSRVFGSLLCAWKLPLLASFTLWTVCPLRGSDGTRFWNRVATYELCDPV